MEEERDAARYSLQMSEIQVRLATETDAALIASQRRAMFTDAVSPAPLTLTAMQERFEPWVRERLANGSYRGWIAESAGVPVAGAGLWVMEFPPHFLDVEAARGYLLNFYVEPGHRGAGLARRLLALCVEEGRRLGLRVLTLHASKFGRPLYEQHGFRGNNEMILLSDGSTETTI